MPRSSQNHQPVMFR